MPPLAGCALKFMGILVMVVEYPMVTLVIISTSIISLYYYLRVFICSAVCLGESRHV